MDETVDKIEKDSKLLYKKYASIHLSHTSELRKKTNYLEKWHDVSRKKISKQEELMRKSLERLSNEKKKYSPFSSTDQEEQNKDLQKITKRLSQQGPNPKDDKATESNPQSRRGSKVDGDQSRRGSKVDEGQDRRQSLVSKKESTKPVYDENVPSTSQRRVVIDESNASKVSHVQDEPTLPPTISRRDASARRLSLGLPSSPRKDSITRRKSVGSTGRESSALDKLSGTVYDLNPQEIDLARFNEIQELLQDTSQFRNNPQSRRGSKVDGDKSRRGSKVDEGEDRRHSLVSKNVPSTSQMKEKAKEKKETDNATKTVVIDESNGSKVSHVQDEPTPSSTISRRDSSARRLSLGLPSSPRKSSITRRKSVGLASRESSALDKLSGTVYDLNPQEIDLAKLNEIQELLHATSQFRKRNKSRICTDNRYFRVQQRRICRLKEILAMLKKPTPKTFTPRELLNCSYLRLSKSNVEELEQMIRNGGEDPGLHYHSDLSNYDLFSELRKEMADVIQNEEEVQCSTSQNNIASPPTKNDILHMRRNSNRD